MFQMEGCTLTCYEFELQLIMGKSALRVVGITRKLNIKATKWHTHVFIYKQDMEKFTQQDQYYLHDNVNFVPM